MTLKILITLSILSEALNFVFSEGYLKIYSTLDKFNSELSMENDSSGIITDDKIEFYKSNFALISIFVIQFPLSIVFLFSTGYLVFYYGNIYFILGAIFLVILKVLKIHFIWANNKYFWIGYVSPILGIIYLVYCWTVINP